MICRKDQKADQLVKIYLSFFSLSRVIKLAKRVNASTFKSIIAPADLDTVSEVVGQLKGCLPTIMNRYLPRLSKIPLCQGMSWTPTWKSLPTYKQMTECLRQEVEGAARFVRHGLQSPFPALMYELLAYTWLMERIHVTEEYQSTGLLWPQRVRFSGDRNKFSGIDRVQKSEGNGKEKRALVVSVLCLLRI
jgi:hypothetical protein